MSKKLMIIALMAVLTLGVSISQASPSRMETVGQGSGLSYLHDDTNIFGNPAALGAYRNVVLLHLGGFQGGDPYALGGVSLGLGEMLTLGIIVGRNPNMEEGVIGGLFSANTALSPNPAFPATSKIPYLFNNNWAAWNVPTDVTQDINAAFGTEAGHKLAMDWMNPIDIILAAKFGNMTLGVSWYGANGKHTDDISRDAPAAIDTTEEETAHLNALKIGLAADMGNIAPELYFHYVPFKVNSKWEDGLTGWSLERELKGRRFNLGTRIFVKLNDNLTIVPAFEWINGKGDVTYAEDTLGVDVIVNGTTITVDDLAEGYKMNGIRAGVGINWANDKVLVASSLGLQYSKSVRTLEVDGLVGSVTDTEKLFDLPIVSLGVEYQATKILVIRTGINTTTLYGKRTTISEADTYLSYNPSDEGSITEQSTSAAAGVGLHFGNLIVDLTAGGALISSEPDSAALFSGMDVKYKF